MDAYMTMWLMLAIMFLVAEVLTVSLVSIWFVAGSLGALAAAVLGAGVGIQIGIFILVSAVLLIFTMPLAKKLTKKEKQPTNYDRIIGRKGVVTVEIDDTAGSGQINVLGSIWSAKSQNGENIKEGAEVTILDVQGVKAIVSEKQN